MAEVIVPRFPSRTACRTFSRGLVEPVLGDDRDRLPGALLGVDDPVGRGQGDVDRLLDDDVLAGVQGGHGAVGVQAAGRADGDGVDVVAAQDRVEVGGGLGRRTASASSCALAGSRSTTVTSSATSGRSASARAWILADDAGADEGEPELLGAHEYAIPSLSRMAVNARVARVKFVGPGERAALVVGAEVRLHREEAVEAVGGQRADGLADLPVALAGGHHVTGGEQRVLDLDVDGVRAERRVAVGERGDAHLHVVGGVPGQPQGRGADRLDDVEHAVGDVAVDVLLVLVQQHDAGGRGLLGEGGHPPEHLVAVLLRRLVRAQEEGEDPDERGAEALRDGQRPVGPDQVGVEVVLDIDLAER